MGLILEVLQGLPSVDSLYACPRSQPCCELFSCPQALDSPTGQAELLKLLLLAHPATPTIPKVGGSKAFFNLTLELFGRTKVHLSRA